MSKGKRSVEFPMAYVKISDPSMGRKITAQGALFG